MPKKKNFLGGMQNYNAQTGEYEPALKGPNGESPSGFKSFKKGDDDSFESTNKKRMGKAEDAQEFHERVVREGQEKWEKDANPLQKWHTTQDYRDRHNELAEKHNKGEITEEELFDGLKKLDTDFEEGKIDYNAKRMGKETPKNNKSGERKDKYGNPLLSDDAFKVGQKAAQEYLDQLNAGEGFEKAKGSFVTLGGFQDAISDALEQAGYNQDYDLTYQDLNEIVGSVTGEEVDFEDYEGNGKGWTGKKYDGYVPKDNSLEEKDESFDGINAKRTGKEKAKTVKPQALANKIKTETDVREVFGQYLNDKELSSLSNSKNLYVEISKQYNGEDNYKIIDDKYIKDAFKNGNGTIKDLEEHIKSNKDNAYFIKIR